MKTASKILGHIIAATTAAILANWFYEWLGKLTKVLGGLRQTVTGKQRKHWAEYLVPICHVAANALLIVNGFKQHWAQGVATVAVVAYMYGYTYWPQISEFSGKQYARIVRLFGCKVGVHVETPNGPVVDVAFRVLAHGA